MDVLIQLVRGEGGSLQRQLADQIRHAIRDGRLLPGARLPSTRQLARDLHVSRTIAEDAYGELASDGYVAGRQGSGTFVAHDLPSFPAATALPPPSRPHRWLAPTASVVPDAPPQANTIEFRLGQPSVAPLPLDVWRSIWGTVSAHLPPADYGPAEGDPELRAAIAAYLHRARGLACTADDVVITVGARQGFDLLVRATLSPKDAAAVEDPGYPEARYVLETHGIRIVPVPVDRDGLRVDLLAEGGQAPTLVYVTPSHQYPLGGRLTIARRFALLEWARRNDSLIVEDDYDSEFRFDAPPLPALAGMDGADQVAYLGTFSKVLTPAMRVGYLVVKGALRERIGQLKYVTDRHTPWPVQHALYAFIRDGHFDRHIRRMRRHYAQKRAVLQSEFARIAPVASLQGIEAGLHAFLAFDAPVDMREIVAAVAERGVVVRDVAPYYIGNPTCQGVLLGYGGLDLADVVRGARVVASVIESAVTASA